MAREEIIQNNAGETPAVLFPETKEIEPCSFNKCGRGHTWRPILVIAQCPGCTGPVLATKLENCPICNDPAVFMQLRNDHVPTGGGIPKVCCGDSVRGETTAILMDRVGFKKIEERETPLVEPTPPELAIT